MNIRSECNEKNVSILFLMNIPRKQSSFNIILFISETVIAAIRTRERAIFLSLGRARHIFFFSAPRIVEPRMLRREKKEKESTIDLSIGAGCNRTFHCVAMTKQRSNRGMAAKATHNWSGRRQYGGGYNRVGVACTKRTEPALGPANYLGGPAGRPAHLPSRIRRVRDPQASEVDVATTAAQFWRPRECRGHGAARRSIYGSSIGAEGRPRSRQLHRDFVDRFNKPPRERKVRRPYAPPNPDVYPLKR